MSDDHQDVLIAVYLFEDLAEKDFDAVLKLADDGTITVEGVVLKYSFLMVSRGVMEYLNRVAR